MEIIIEIGTDYQKELIKQELQCLIYYFKNRGFEDKVDKIIITNNFDDTINKMLNIDYYRSTRKDIQHEAIAKFIFQNNRYNLIFSSLIYNDRFDTQVRLLFYIHELSHILNHELFIRPTQEDTRFNRILTNLNDYYDEYYAYRFSATVALDYINSNYTISSFLNDYLNQTLQHHQNSLLNKHMYYKPIKKLINKFRCRKIIHEIFFNDIFSLIRGYTLDMIIIFSYCDSEIVDKYEYMNNLHKSCFFNSSTTELINFFRNKYDYNDFNLKDGIDIFENYYTNFGLRFEDTDKGIYCHVFPIY